MGDAEKAQGKILMYQVLQAELEQLNKQGVMINNRLIDLETTDHALNEMVKFSKDKDSMVPIGSGCYAQGSVSGSGVLLDIGGGVMVKREIKTAKTFIEERKDEIEDAAKKLQLQMNDVVKNINELMPEIQKIVKEQQGQHDHHDHKH